ncbi:MAG TPA: heme-degrading domain-containing protein [Terracidiphilus sp.]|nr:heme-degrading domain-containing protein [Terracidiphilus sp.]
MGVAEDLTCVTLQERELRLPRFDPEVAWELGTRLRTMAVERGLAIVIDVRRFNQPLFYAALEGTTPDNPEWVRRKSNVVARYHRSSYGMGLNLKLKGQTLEERGHSTADFAAHGGSFPIHLEAAGILGSVTVSGLPQRADHELVVEALCAHLGRDYESLKLGPEED